MPARLVGVIGSGGLHAVVEQPDEDDADRVAAWVAARIAESAELFKANTFQSGLFFQLARRRLFELFVLINEATGESPRAFEWLTRPFDQHHLKPFTGAAKQNHVNGHRGTRVFIAIGFL